MSALSDSLPTLRSGSARPLYFLGLDELDRADLQAKGYAPLSVFELPRLTPQDEVNYLLAKAQGIEEGTIVAGENDLKVLELEMKANRMLGQKHTVMRVNIDMGKKAAQDLLDDWRPSRHTLRGNTTITPQALAPITGVRRRGKVAKKEQK